MEDVWLISVQIIIIKQEDADPVQLAIIFSKEYVFKITIFVPLIQLETLIKFVQVVFQTTTSSTNLEFVRKENLDVFINMANALHALLHLKEFQMCAWFKDVYNMTVMDAQNVILLLPKTEKFASSKIAMRLLMENVKDALQVSVSTLVFVFRMIQNVLLMLDNHVLIVLVDLN